MAEHGKRYQDAAKLVDRTRAYPLDKAVSLIEVILDGGLAVLRYRSAIDIQNVTLEFQLSR